MTQLMLIFDGLAGFLHGSTQRERQISSWRLKLVKEERIGDEGSPEGQRKGRVVI